MTLRIDLSNQLTRLSLIKKQLNDKTNITQTNLVKEVVSTPCSGKETTSLTSSSAESMLNKETVNNYNSFKNSRLFKYNLKKTILILTMCRV
jgi:hypothetical protein